MTGPVSMPLAPLLEQHPPVRKVSVAAIRAEIAQRPDHRYLLLDDDPTGTQTLADIPVLTKWDDSDFAWAFQQPASVICVLSNTRSLDRREAEARVRTIARTALAAAAARGIRLTLISRGDSTLRGHFPLEVNTLREQVQAAGGRIDTVVVVPAFPEAGRVTLDGVHYHVADGIAHPVGSTEFATDATFGYRSSHLGEYVAEKTGDAIAAETVEILDLTLIRSHGADAVAAQLSGGGVFAVDAAGDDDLRILALGLARAELGGTGVVLQAGPSILRALLGQEPQPPLNAADAFPTPVGATVGGLIVVGSHVGLTSRQLADLLTHEELAGERFELSLAGILDAGADAYLDAVAVDVTAALARGNVVINTARELRRGSTPQESLEIARLVSAAVVGAVTRVVAAVTPRFVIAKGGITSSDVATEALGIRHAWVRGPMLPGLVSAWEPRDGRTVGIPYIVFAGNVGQDDSLTSVVRKLTDPTLTASARTASTRTVSAPNVSAPNVSALTVAALTAPTLAEEN